MTKDQALDWLAWGIMVALLAVVLVSVARQAWRYPAQAAMAAAMAAIFWAAARLLRKADRYHDHGYRRRP